jgi:crotonobetainyl-CoA:carnitine CoA-transferase CaiB-like acyl-CoA transferase
MWPGLCRALELPELEHDPRFAGPWDRDANADELEALLEARFAGRRVREWLDLLVANDVPCGPVNDYRAVAEDEQALANGYLTTVEHPNLGPIRTAGIPLGFSGTPAALVRPAPELGQHTEAILLDAGYTWQEIEGFRIGGVI